MSEPHNGRHANGRFSKGNRGGPGRPRRRVEVEYLACLSDTVTFPTWKKIVKRAVADALAGDNAARNWLSKYLLSDAENLLTLAGRELDPNWTIETEISNTAEGES